MADLDYDSALTLSATAMRRAMEADVGSVAIVHAIDALRLAVLAASRDLVDALGERAAPDQHIPTAIEALAIATGAQVVAQDDEDDDLTMATAPGYHCIECDFHVLVDDPDYDARSEAHDAFHDAVDQAGRRNQGQVEQFLQHVEDRLFYASSQSVDPDDVDRISSWTRVEAGTPTVTPPPAEPVERQVTDSMFATVERMQVRVSAERELHDYLSDASKHEHGKLLTLIYAGIRSGAAVEMARALRGDDQ